MFSKNLVHLGDSAEVAVRVSKVHSYPTRVSQEILGPNRMLKSFRRPSFVTPRRDVPFLKCFGHWFYENGRKVHRTEETCSSGCIAQQ